MAGPEGRGHTEGVWREVPLEQVHPGPYQARRIFDAELLRELADTVRAHGVLQPVLLRPSAGGFEIVAGERRWRAARLAGLTSVPAVVREMSDREAAELALVENLQRDDLQFFEEAEGYRQLLEEFKLSQQELANRVGKSQPTVANKLRLLRLEPRVRERVVEAGLTERHTRALLQLDSEAERLRAVEAFASRGMTVREAEAWLHRRARPSPRRRLRGSVSDARILRNAFAAVTRGLERAGFAVELRETVEAEAWEVHVRVTRRAGDGAKRRRA